MKHLMCVVEGGGSKAQVAGPLQAGLEQPGGSFLVTLAVCGSANGGRALGSAGRLLKIILILSKQSKR